jgi:hypothetical protein
VCGVIEPGLPAPAALHVLALRAAQQRADVVARLARIEQLAEHLDARDRGLHRRLQANDLNLLAHAHHAALHAPRHHRAATRNREHVLDRHQEGTVLRTLGLRNVAVHLRHQLHDRLLADLRRLVLERRHRGALDDRNVVARELVGGEQLAHLHLHKLHQVRIRQVHLVQEHHQRRHAHLARQQDVLPRLRHRAVGGRHHQDRPVHLRRTRDHVLHVVGVAQGSPHARSAGSSVSYSTCAVEIVIPRAAPPAPCRSGRTP